MAKHVCALEVEAGFRELLADRAGVDGSPTINKVDHLRALLDHRVQVLEGLLVEGFIPNIENEINSLLLNLSDSLYDLLC